MVDLPVLIVMLFLLMPAALWLAGFARARQDQRIMTLFRLEALERRRHELDAAIAMFEQLGAGEDVLDALRQALLHDLERIGSLDPQRSDIARAIDAAGRKEGRRKKRDDGQAAVNSEQELGTLRNRAQRALQLLSGLQQHGTLPGDAVSRARRGLEVLVARVGVNTFVLMARHAMEKANTMKAFSYYRKAERLARYASLPEHQQRESLDMIEAEKQRLLQRNEDDRGLMLLAQAE